MFNAKNSECKKNDIFKQIPLRNWYNIFVSLRMLVINVVIVIFIFLKLLLLFVNCIDYFGITDRKDTY